MRACRDDVVWACRGHLHQGYLSRASLQPPGLERAGIHQSVLCRWRRDPIRWDEKQRLWSGERSRRPEGILHGEERHRSYLKLFTRPACGKRELDWVAWWQRPSARTVNSTLDHAFTDL